jgi:hypothetical protein
VNLPNNKTGASNAICGVISRTGLCGDVPGSTISKAMSPTNSIHPRARHASPIAFAVTIWKVGNYGNAIYMSTTNPGNKDKDLKAEFVAGIELP